MQYLYRNMEFLHLDEGRKVFNYGEVGELFYIIMNGEISIKTPFPEELEEDQSTPIALLTYFLTFFKDIDWSFFKEGE